MAGDLYRETLVLRKKVLGAEHPQTLNTMSDVASVLGQAEAIHE